MIFFLNFTAMMEAERAKIEQMTAAWDDPTNTDWVMDEQAAAETEVVPEVGEEVAYRCLALYNYTVRPTHRPINDQSHPYLNRLKILTSLASRKTRT
jgi:division protein CdvB (Snf7/Vps24/ESCRT-III family)